MATRAPIFNYDDRRYMQALRGRILDGAHRDDAQSFIDRTVGRKRAAHWSFVNLSKVLMEEVINAICVRYRSAPTVGGRTPDDAERLGKVLGKSRWLLARELQRRVEAIRDYYLRIDWSGDLKNPLSYSLVNPSRVFDEIPDLNNRGRVLALTVETLGKVPLYERWDISNPANPVYRRWEGSPVARTDGMGVLTLAGEKYPYRKTDGTAYINLILYHAKSQVDKLYDWKFGEGLVDATFNVSLLQTYALHAIRNAAMAPRYVIDLIMRGQGVTAEGTGFTETDPTIIHGLSSTKADRAGSVGQWESSVDTEKIYKAIDHEINNAQSGYGITQAENQRVSAEGRSGWAIQLSRSQIRERQADTGTAYETADIESLEVSAALYNAYATKEHIAEYGEKLPEDGWSVAYAVIPLSSDEELKRRELLKSEFDQGLISREDYYARLYGVPLETARARLAEVDTASAKLKAAATAPSTLLNGAQIESLVTLAEKVGAGLLAPATAAAIAARSLGIEVSDALPLVGVSVVKPPNEESRENVQEEPSV